MKEYFKAGYINTDDPDNLEIFSLATTVSGDLTAKEIYPNVYVISNALTKQHLDYLNNFCRTATKEDWESYYKDKYGEGSTVPAELDELTRQNEDNYWSDRSMTIKDVDICNEINERVAPFFGERFFLPVINEVHRQKIGDGMDEHCDGGPARPNLLRSMLFYINDDYEGGELYFPALDLEYKPKAGDFITFPSYEKYTHGVRHVLSGSDRYVLAGFAWKT